jgi:ATP/maltotriose-dependent transcriptional regulator MalT
MAEQIQVMHILGSWVIQKAIADAATWPPRADGQAVEAELEVRLALGEAARQHLVKPLYELHHRQPQWLAAMLPALRGESLRQRLLRYEREPEVVLPAPDETVLSNRELTVLRLIAQGCSNQ